MIEVISAERHAVFIKTAIEKGIVYGLQSDAGWATALSSHYEETTVVPFWSEEAAAAAVCQDDWAEFEPVMVDLSEFLEAWLMGMHNDGHMVGTNWDTDLIGTESEPLELALQLIKGLQAANKRVRLDVYADLAAFEKEIREIMLEEEGI